MVNVWKKSFIGFIGTASLAGAVAAGAPPAQAQDAVSKPSTRSAIISGSGWLSGKGVSVQRGRQCVELATRLYSKRGWGTLNNIYSGRPSHRSVKFYKNKKSWRPAAGSVIVEVGGSYGHVAVVNKVKGNTIYAVEQNAAPNGRKTYRISGKKQTITGGYRGRKIKGFYHSKKNKMKVVKYKAA